MNGGGGSSDVFAAIAAPARREILCLLAEKGEMPVTQIAECFEMTMSAVSQHLAILKDAELVTITKVGRQRVYRVTPDRLLEVAAWLKQYEQFWNRKLDRLGIYLEKQDD